MTHTPFPALRSGQRLSQRPSPASKVLTIISGILLLSVGMVPAEDKAAKPSAIVCAMDGPTLEILAARELRRYWYLRTGDLLPIVPSMEQQSSGGGFVVGRKDRAMLRETGGTPAWNATLAGIGPQHRGARGQTDIARHRPGRAATARRTVPLAHHGNR